MVRIREEERILVGENSRRLIERNTMFSLVLRILRCIPLDLRWYHIYSIPTMPLLRNRYFECFCPANAQVKPRAPSENKASRQLQPVVRQRFFHIEWFFICHSNFGCPIRLTRGAAIKFRIAASAKSKNSPRRTSSFMSKEPPTPLYLG